MMSYITAIALFVVPFLLYKLATRNFDYWKKRKVAHPPPKPFIGNVLDFILGRCHMGIIMQKIYNAYPDQKYAGAFLGKNPLLVVRDPELLKLIMAKDFYYFYSRGMSDPILMKQPLNNNLLFSDGDQWRVLRQNLTPLFSSAKMKNMFHLMVQCGKQLEEYIQSEHHKTDQHDIRDLMSRFTIDVIGTCAFGLQMNAMSDEDSQFRKIARSIFKPSIVKIAKQFLMVTAPRLFIMLGLQLDRNADEFFTDLSRKVIALREGRPAERHDFVDLLVELKRKGHIDGDSIESMKPGGERKTASLELTEHTLAAQSFIFFIAGFETSSTTMSYALHELALNPDIKKRVHDEIDTLLAKHNGQITYELVQEATYLEKVVSETLRKYPVLTLITRECTNKYTLPGGLVLDSGVKVFVPVYGLHHDPQYYPNPEIFDPERFSPEAIAERPPYVYLPFGEGQRLCIGMRFGKMQVAVGLISLLRTFTVEPCAKTEKTITIEPKLPVTTPKNGIWLKITPRGKQT